MRVIDNWIDAGKVPEGEVFVVDLNALKKEPQELPWSVEISGARPVAYFFNEHDAIEYAEWLANKIDVPTVTEP